MTLRELVNFDVSNFNIDCSGYDFNSKEIGCFNRIFWDYIINSLDKSPMKILELGTWYGYGINTTSKYLKDNQVEHEIICVDTWLGSLPHYFENKKELKNHLGYPQFYYDFLKVTKIFSNTDTISAFPQTTRSACKYLLSKNIKFDTIIIDAEHEYEDVFEELTYSSFLLNNCGFIIIDDLAWPGVKKAYSEFNNLKFDGFCFRPFYTKNIPNQLLIQKLKE
jgi:hypothetical protein